MAQAGNEKSIQANSLKELKLSGVLVKEAEYKFVQNCLASRVYLVYS